MLVLQAGNAGSLHGWSPKQDQYVIGTGPRRPVLNGAVQLSTWTVSGSDFWSDPGRPAPSGRGPNDPGDGNRCRDHRVREPQRRLLRRGTAGPGHVLGALDPGKFFEDFTAGRVYIRDTHRPRG